MAPMTRRTFTRWVGTAGTLSVFGTLGWPATARAAKGRVVVIGGGFGGATCAKYLRRTNPGLEVTLVERDTRFLTCPFSNAVLGGFRSLDSLTQRYDKLRQKHGVKIVHDTATAIDATSRTVTLHKGTTLRYDRLVVSPGVDLKWHALPGYDEAASQIMPHAWKAGPQTTLLRQQLAAMPDGGVVIIVAPADPFRCPPGPYERASLMAHYLKTHKPKSKILILDAKERFSKQALFMNAWQEVYPQMIEWRAGTAGGKVLRVDPQTMTVETDLGAEHGAVINVIPPQSAGQIALQAGLANDKGWCPVDQTTFESTIHKGIHVIGDACIAGKMPKSGFAANNQAKICAAAIATLLAGGTPAEPLLINTCYSLISPDYGITIAGVYKPSSDGLVEVQGSGGVSPANAPADFRKREAEYAVGWYDSIMSDMFA